MRIRPDGVELLRAARAVIDTAIAPHIAPGRRDALREIEQAMALAEDRLARDVDASVADLAALDIARATMRGAMHEALPEERRYDARLVAKAIAVATRQLANGHLPERREYERLAALLGAPALADVSPHECRCALPALNERLGARIRLGEADMGTTSYAATLAHLEAITNEALSESNPTYRRPTPGPLQSGSNDTPCSALPDPSVSAAVAAWREVPRAVRGAVIGVPLTAPFSRRGYAWLQMYGSFGKAMCVSGNAAFALQANLLGWFAERLAANPRVPMVAVESAHQAHDLSVAIADASAGLFELTLAPLGVGPSPEAARLP